MAKGNEEEGRLLVLAAVMMKVFAEDYSFMLCLTQWNCRLSAKDGPAPSPPLVIMGQVCGKPTNLNSSPLDLLTKQPHLLASSLLYQMQVGGGTSLPRWGTWRGKVIASCWQPACVLNQTDRQQMSALIPCFMLAVEAGNFTCLREWGSVGFLLAFVSLTSWTS